MATLVLLFTGTIQALANTDYICYEKVVCENTCHIGKNYLSWRSKNSKNSSSWTKWNAQTHRRTSHGYKRCTILNYFSRRQSCRASYPSGVSGAQKVRNISFYTGLEMSGDKKSGDTKGATGGHTKNASRSMPCSIYQYDLAIPACDFQKSGNSLKFRCVPKGPSPCTVYKNWTKIDFAKADELRTIGIGTEAGIYNGCIVPSK